jgi:hypothetical protein
MKEKIALGICYVLITVFALLALVPCLFLAAVEVVKMRITKKDGGHIY